MKKYPKLYKNEFKDINNHNINSYHIKDNLDLNDEKATEEILKKIFNGNGHPYNIKVFIKTNDKTYETYLVSRNGNALTTIENNNILIDDIKYLKIIKN